MPLSSAERTSWMMLCPRCGKATEKPVAWLAASKTLACATSDCGNVIDLKSPDNAALIQKLADQCADLDAFLAKPNQFPESLNR